jgi:Amt family ammonium transporter
VGKGGIGSRLWSNEFLAAKPIDHPQAVLDEAMALRELLLALKLPARLSGWTLAASIGAICPKPGADWTQVLQQAGQACDDAKRRGVNQIATYSTSRDSQRDHLINIEYIEEFRRLLSAGSLTLHPQPIVDIRDCGFPVVKAEFLMRVERNGVFMPLPMGMIESLERFNMAAELDRFSAAFVLAWLERNAGAMLRLKNVSINLSAKSVADGNFMYKLFSDVRNARLPYGTLGFEITETTAVEHLDVASEAVAEFRKLGCSFSLDDFGYGLCSFGYLQSLQVDEVKIDGRFVRQVAQDPTSREIINAIHQVAHATGKKTVAEFVDDRRKLDVLREVGIDYAQGHLFYPAVPPEKLLQLLGIDPVTA